MQILVNGIDQSTYADSSTVTVPINSVCVGKQVQFVSLTEDTIEKIAEAIVQRIKEERNERMG